MTDAPTPYPVVFVGDSITDGVGPSGSGVTPTGGFRGIVADICTQKALPVAFVGGQTDPAGRCHEGRDGWRTTDWRGDLPYMLGYVDPRIVVLTIGTNDVYGGNGFAVGNVQLNMASLLDDIQAYDPRIEILVQKIPTSSPPWIMQPVYPGDPTVADRMQAQQAYNWSLNRMCRDRGIRLCDAKCGPADLSDGIHPNDAGYSKMALAIAYALEGIVRKLMARDGVGP